MPASTLSSRSLIRPTEPTQANAAPAVSRRPSAGPLVAAVLSHAPENAAYGLMAFAPLGAAFGPAAMTLALLAAVVANGLATLLGGGRLVGGPRASLALLTAGLVGALVPLWSADTGPQAWRIVAIVAGGVVLAGLLQAMFGLMRLGDIVKYTPYPVRLGLSAGIGLLVALAAWPVVVGLGFGASGAWSPATWHAGALLVAASACVATALATWRRSRVPPLLVGLACGVGMHAVVGALLPGDAGSAVGTPALPPGVLDGLAAATALPAPQTMPWRSTLDLVGAYALTVAVLCSLDTLLATSLVDGRQRRWRDPNRELIAQGMANIGSALSGAQPTSPSVLRSMSLGGSDPPPRHGVLAYALMMLAFIGAAPWIFGVLPLASLGGVMLAQGLQMVSPALLRTPWELLAGWRRARRGGIPHDAGRAVLAAPWLVSITVALGAVLLGVGAAVLLGAALAVLLFVRGNMRDVVRSVWRADARRSLKVRPPAAVQALRDHGHGIAIVELEGALFFGTGDAVRSRLSRLAREVDAVVLDLRQVREVDVTGARILYEIADEWARTGKDLLLSEWPSGDPRRRAVEAMAGRSAVSVLRFHDHADRALERAEDDLLRRVGALASTDDRQLDLADVALAAGLDGLERQLLREAVTEVRFEQGRALFRRGDPGDALYLIVAGEIALHVPGGTRRLASFAPGVSLGEIGLLSGGVRTVDAIAETDVVALRLPAATFERWKREHPSMAAKLLHGIALHVAARLSLLTEDVARWMQRAGARMDADVGAPTLPPPSSAGEERWADPG